MGIRVDERAMKEQLEKAHATDWAELPFHRDLLAGKMPYTIGGGIGQSRLCMLLLGKAHVGKSKPRFGQKEMKKPALRPRSSCCKEFLRNSWVKPSAPVD